MFIKNSNPEIINILESELNDRRNPMRYINENYFIPVFAQNFS